MRELALNILDITENSVKAKADLIEIGVVADGNLLTISIKDNGCGMDAEFLSRVTDPFTTTRTTRKVGLGIPLIKMEAEMAGGTFAIASEKGVGTVVTTTFEIDHIDRPPLGNLAETMVTLLAGNSLINYRLTYIVDGREYVFDTAELKAELGDTPLDAPAILIAIKEMLIENLAEITADKPL